MDKELFNIEKGKNILIFGAAYSSKKYLDKIINFALKKKCVIIGINNITHLCVPDYHLWVNNGRVRDFYKCINPKSTLLIGSHIKPKQLKLLYKQGNKSYSIFYEDDFSHPDLLPHYDENKGYLYGYYRIGGTLAIMIAHCMGAKNIFVTGMDGYSKPIDGNQHCYGKGLTDSNDLEFEAKKDNEISKVLNRLKNFGIRFEIITPTIFTKHYNPKRLKLEENV